MNQAEEKQPSTRKTACLPPPPARIMQGCSCNDPARVNTASAPTTNHSRPCRRETIVADRLLARSPSHDRRIPALAPIGGCKKKEKEKKRKGSIAATDRTLSTGLLVGSNSMDIEGKPCDMCYADR